MSDASPAESRKRAGAGRRIAAVALGVVLALAVAEVLLRVVHVAGPPITTRLLENLDDPTVRYHCYATNPNNELVHLPDVSGGRWRLQKTLLPPVELPLERVDETPWCVEYRNGSLGVRGAAVLPVPTRGTIRIAGIGDSFAYGDGVPESRTLFARLGRDLGDSVEVLNCGQSGADMVVNVRTLEWVLATYSPQRAVVVFVPNDVRMSKELHERESYVFDLINIRAEHMTADGERPWYARASHVTRLLGTLSAMRDVTRETLALYRDRFDPEINGENVAQFRSELRRLAQISQGGGVVLVLYPLMIGFEGGYPLQDVHDQVRAMAEEEGLRVLDLAPLFDGMDTESLWVHDADHHPNGKAHAIAAEALAAWLRDDVPGFLKPR